MTNYILPREVYTNIVTESYMDVDYDKYKDMLMMYSDDADTVEFYTQNGILYLRFIDPKSFNHLDSIGVTEDCHQVRYLYFKLQDGIIRAEASKGGYIMITNQNERKEIYPAKHILYYLTYGK